jgi:hypothetical protein
LSGTSKELLGELLAQSLMAWGIMGSVQCASDGSVLLSCHAADIRVQTAAPDLPFRWMLTIHDRTRGAISLTAVLRQVRSALDPDYAANRARIAFPKVLS